MLHRGPVAPQSSDSKGVAENSADDQLRLKSGCLDHSITI